MQDKVKIEKKKKKLDPTSSLRFTTGHNVAGYEIFHTHMLITKYTEKHTRENILLGERTAPGEWKIFQNQNMGVVN